MFIFVAKKEILHKVSGTFPSGNLIAIMGPSGAGTYSITECPIYYSDKFLHG